MFSADQLRGMGVGEDGLRRWWVTLPYSYDGKALALADWTADDVVTALNDFATRMSYEVAAGRLYSPVSLS